MSKASPKKTQPISWTPLIGRAHVEQDSYDLTDGTIVPTGRLSSCSHLNTSEKDRAAKKIQSYIQKRLRQQKQRTQLSKDIGSLLKTLRTNSDLTVKDAAQIMNWPFGYLFDVEDGKFELSLADFHRILKLYKIDITHELANAKANHQG